MKMLPKCLAIAVPTLFGVLLATTLLGLPVGGSSDVDSITETVLRNQQAYFQKITSLEFDARTVLKLSAEAKEKQGLPTDTIETGMRFASSGLKYRVELTYVDVDTGKTLTTMIAYNGELYQVLDSSDKPTLTVSRATILPIGPHPLMFAFRFAFLPGDTLSLGELQSNEKWSQLAGMVLGSEDATMLGHDGIKLKLKVPSRSDAVEDSYEVFFASDLDYLPIYWRVVHPGAGGGVSECKVVLTESYDDVNGGINIPTRLEFADYFPDGTLAQNGYTQIDTETLMVNFTIPMSRAYRYADKDTGAVTVIRP